VKRSAQSSLHVYDGSGHEDDAVVEEGSEEDVKAVIAELEDEMAEASGNLEFERAALLRDQIDALRSGDYRKAAKSAKKTSGRAYPKAGRRRK
jgi:excinuclease ABC subunit B